MGEHDAQLILIAGGLLAAGILGALLADKVRVPGLLLFLGLGMLAGSQGIGGIDFNNTELARTLGTIALILILFEGGLTAGWSEIRPVLGTAASLATLGTIVTALLAGLAAKLIFDISTLEGLIVGSAIAATDSAAIFAVLRRSTLEKRLARSLEGESGMNDPVALLLVIGFIEWIQEPGFGLADMAGLLALKLAVGIAVGWLIGRLAVAALNATRLPTDGIYPVATIAIAALAYGVAEVAHGSGLLAVYLTALALGGASIPARRTVVAFHEGLGWVAQIALFILLGLLVFPSRLDDIALKGLALSAVLILVARPIATFVATDLRAAERARESDARLGRAARGDADLARHLPRRRRHRRRRDRVRDRLLRRRHLDPGPGRQLRAAGDPAGADHRRAGAAAAAARVGADPPHGRRRDRLPAAAGRRRGGAPGARAGAAARGAGQRDRPRRPRDPAARLDRNARGRRAPHPRPRRAARRGRGADQDLDQGPGRATAAAGAAAPRRLAGLLGAAGARGRRPAGAARGRRDSGAERSCAAAATASGRWPRSPTVATR